MTTQMRACSQFRSTPLVVRMKEVAVSHPVLGDLYVGDSVSLFSGDNANPFFGYIAQPSTNDTEIIVHWLWRPEELLRQLAESGHVPRGRTIQSFASNELVLGTKSESTPLGSIEDRIDVFHVDQLPSVDSKAGDLWFYRQSVDDAGTWELTPHIEPTVVLPDGTMSVENPGMKYFACVSRSSPECRDGFVYPSEQRRDRVGDNTGLIPFTCSHCVTAGADGEAEPSGVGGVEWLNSVSEESLTMPDDPKRSLVVDKFTAAIASGLDEIREDVNLVFTTPEVIRQFSIAVEAELHCRYEEVPKEYKAKVFRLNFNLSDRKNESIRRRIISGQFSPAELANATSDVLASDDVKEKRKEQRDKYFATQVLKRAEDPLEEILPQPKRVRDEGVGDAMDVVVTEIHDSTEEVDVPSFAPPPAVVSSRETSTEVDMIHGNINTADVPDGDDAHQQHKVSNDMVDEPVHPAEAVESKSGELRLYAESLKSRIGRLEYASLREHSQSFVDYLTKHIIE